MTAVAISVMSAYGVHLVYTALSFGWSGVRPGPASARSRSRRGASDWLSQAGLEEVRPAEFASVVIALGMAATVAAYIVFGAPLPAVAIGLFAASFPPAAYRNRRRLRRELAQESWPRMIEELRILTGSLGRSVPQALFEVGRRAPEAMQPAFTAAHREWLMSTDFPRTVSVLKERLADPTADATCETLLVAHDLGGSDLDRRLEALIDDRIQDVQGRKDARAKQAGVRFARRFVLVVPMGMALAGMSVGNGRSAYATPTGQLAVAIGIGAVVGCWLWAGAFLKIPEEERVFAS